jgi:hypothetical protein
MTTKLPPRYARTLQMLKRKRGVTADELINEFGIQRHTARAVVSLTAKQAGVTVERDKETGRYRAH